MTKLQVLNAYFTERLMVAVHEIMNVVGETLFEYQDETERTKRENEILRRRLRDVGLDAEAGFPQSAPLLSADRTVSEQQEWSSREQDPDPPLTAVKLEFTEPQSNRREEEEDHRQEEELHCAPESGTDGSVIPSPCSKRECDLDTLNQPTFPSPCGKQGSQQDSDNHPDVILHIGNTEEQELVPNVTHYPVKTETGGVDCDISDHPAESLFLDVLPTQSENGGRRLMAAMQEIMQVVEGTLMEYQEENDRTKKENEVLRRKLRGAGLDSETANAVSKSAPLLSADRTVSEQQEWSSREQDPDPPLTAVKLEFTEPQRNRREEEEDHRQEEELHCAPESGADGSVIPSPCSKRECDPALATFPSPRGKRESRPGSRNHPDPKLQIGNAEEQDPVPDVAQRQVKTESDRVDCDLSVRPAESAPGGSCGAGTPGTGAALRRPSGAPRKTPLRSRGTPRSPAFTAGRCSSSCRG
ncbi:hypothetical protein COCON_G00173040 [Conger conger]|uniref:Uncharacterized protein n=1 Tax=Conger conger TaxID=82655 RepID=A0A9Q1D4R7_CONCO|nr:hypothetical protein COCON_G00173040 [Conger conger]